MQVFSKDSRGVEAWGTIASADVKVSALDGVVDNSWILTSFAVGAREIVDIRQCFGDVSFLYALGNKQASCSLTLTFMVLIGRKSCKGNHNMDAVSSGLEAYVFKRIGASGGRSPSTVEIGGFSRFGWLVGIDIGNVDADKGICQAVVHMNMRLCK